MPKVESLKQKFQKQAKSKSRTPVWAGPESSEPNGGVTQSLLARRLVCMERFRLHVIEGLQPAPTWHHRMGYGNMWHVCEEWNLKEEVDDTRYSWKGALQKHANEQLRLFPMQQEQIAQWYEICKVQFPLYIQYWSKRKDQTERKNLGKEITFHVPYRLPSGRTVYLRGKWDAVDLVGRGKRAGIYLGENKTKERVDEETIRRQLSFDLQTMLYRVAFEEALDSRDYPFYEGRKTLGYDAPIVGVNYNVVKRPTQRKSAGTQGSKCSRKSCRDKPDRNCDKCNGTGRVGAKSAETNLEFAQRIGEEIKKDPSQYFMRWRCEVFPSDVKKFKQQFLDPCLEMLCDWYEDQASRYRNNSDPFADNDRVADSKFLHYRTPFGIYNPLAEGGFADVDSYLEDGIGVGLQQVETLFPELQ